MSIVQKTYKVETKIISEEDGMVRFVASTEGMDRDGEVIKAVAWKSRLKSFMDHPVLLSSHDYKSLKNQIGEIVSLDVAGSKLVGVAKYYINEGNEEADWGFKLARRGKAAYSVGFLPHEFNRGIKATDPKITYTDVELLEISHVSVPSNRESLQTLSVKGMDPVVQELATEILQEIINNDAEEKSVGQDDEIRRIELTQEKCMEVASSWYQRRAPQNVAEYAPLGGSEGRACANCLFFSSPNRCTAVDDWPIAISPTGISRYWTAIPEMKPMEVVIVGAKSQDEVDTQLEVETTQVDNWDLVRSYLQEGKDIPQDVLVTLAMKAIQGPMVELSVITGVVDAADTFEDGTVEKAGRRNSQADMDKMREVMRLMNQTMDMMQEVMGEDRDQEMEPEEKAKKPMMDEDMDEDKDEDEKPVTEENEEEKKSQTNEPQTVSVDAIIKGLDLAAIRRLALEKVFEKLTAGSN